MGRKRLDMPRIVTTCTEIVTHALGLYNSLENPGSLLGPLSLYHYCRGGKRHSALENREWLQG